jgi:FdhD protein
MPQALEPKTSSTAIDMERFQRHRSFPVRETVATEEPLEIRIEFGPRNYRVNRALSVSMRTPGHDRYLAAGFLYTEGVIRDSDEIGGERFGRK